MEKLVEILRFSNNLANICANRLILFLDKKIDDIDTNRKQLEIKYPIKYPLTFSITVILFFIFFLVLFFDFWTGDINKSRLDTFIVVASLISLIIGNISKSYKIDFFDDYITHILKYMAGSMLFGLFIGLSLFFIFIVILYFMQPSYLPHFNTNLVLSIVIIIGILLLISFTFLLLSEVLANRKNLFYSIWWTFILVLYVIKIYA